MKNLRGGGYLTIDNKEDKPQNIEVEKLIVFCDQLETKIAENKMRRTVYAGGVERNI